MATEADLDDLVEFRVRLAFETEDKTLDRDLVRQGVLDCLKNPSLGFYYVAWDEADDSKKSLGTTMLTYELNVMIGG